VENLPQALPRSEFLARLAMLVDALRLDRPTRVAFDGPDTAGKTTLADELAAVLRERGRHVLRASIDGFHHPRAARYARGADSPEGYYLDSFDHDAVRATLLDPLGPAGDRRYRTAVFDHRTDRPVAAPVESAPRSALLLFDGVFLQRPELRDGFDLSIFVTVSVDEVLRRALERDVPLLGARDEVERRYRTRYIPGQRLYIADARPDAIADVLVRNDDPVAPVLERVGGRALSPETGRPAR
jgi:uridine kinase